MWKFRSMATGADRVGPVITGAFDFRVTRVGAFLRRTKLDELPQLVNVLAGQMSLVGPRPEAPSYVNRWTDEERAILAFRPGITGPTQIAYIDEEELLQGDPSAVYESELMHAKLAVDLEYVRRYSLRRDIGIMWKTLVGILSAGERRTNRPRRRFTLGERLASARLGPILLDAVLAAIAAALAVGLRIDRNNIFAAIATYWVFVPLAAIVRPVGFLIGGAYLRVWRYPTVSDAALVVSSLAAGSVIMTILIFVVMQPWAFPGSVGFPRSAIIIEFLLSFIVLGGIRFASRIRQEGLEDATAPTAAGPPRPVLIYGAGEAGALLAREMRRNRALRMDPVGFLDDDPDNRGRRIYGVDVVGSANDLPLVVAEREVAEVIVAMPRIAGDRLRHIVALCEAAGVAVRTLPAVNELLDDTVSVNRVRPVRVEDLLRREATAIPEEPMRALVGGRTVLVTGAGGSIGSELCRQVASLGVGRLVLFERAETPLFYVDEELRRRFPDTDVVAGDRRRHRSRLGGARLRARAAAGRLPCRCAEARAAVRVERGVDGLDQRPWHAPGGRGGGGRRRRSAHLHQHRQGGRPVVDHGRDEAHRRRDRQGAGRIGRWALRGRALRQRDGLAGVGPGALPTADHRRRPGDGDPPGHDPLLHDDPGGRAAHPARRGDRAARRHPRPQHGPADPDHRPRPRPDPPVGARGRTRHPDLVHRAAPGREARGDAVRDR